MVAPPRKGSVKRQETFGPDAPIHEWELERANLLRERREYKERAEHLERQMENDRATYEKNAASLLREIKTKEAAFEKYFKESEAKLEEQVLGLQQQLQQTVAEHESELRDLRKQHDQMLQSEQKKYERRTKALQERLYSRREHDYTQEPVSPRSDGTGPSSPVSDAPKERMEWPTRWPAEPTRYAQELSSIPEEQCVRKISDGGSAASPDKGSDENDSREQRKPSPIAILTKTSEHDSIELGLQRRIAVLEQRLTEQEATFRDKTNQLKRMHDDELQRLRDLFVHENRDVSMYHEARLQNLQMEHKQTVSELQEQYENELSVQTIELESQMDTLRRTLEKRYEERMATLQQAWQTERSDLHASMSKGAQDSQRHWESKIQAIQADHQAQLKRLQDEMEVVKSRLGNEITRRHQLQEQMAQWQEEYAASSTTAELIELQRHHHALQCRLDKLARQHRDARKIAKEIIQVITQDPEEDKACLHQRHLVDLLQCTLRRATVLSARQHALGQPVHGLDVSGAPEAYHAMLVAL